MGFPCVLFPYLSANLSFRIWSVAEEGSLCLRKLGNSVTSVAFLPGAAAQLVVCLPN